MRENTFSEMATELEKIKSVLKICINGLYSPNNEIEREGIAYILESTNLNIGVLIDFLENEILNISLSENLENETIEIKYEEVQK